MKKSLFITLFFISIAVFSQEKYKASDYSLPNNVKTYNTFVYRYDIDLGKYFVVEKHIRIFEKGLLTYDYVLENYLDRVSQLKKFEYNAKNQLVSIKEAEDALKAWDLSTKSQKKAEDAAAKALEIKIGLLKESYEIYKKLAEIKGKDAAKEMIATDPAFARYKNLPGGSKVPTSTTELSNAIAPVIAASNQNSAGVKKMYRENAKLGMEGYIEGVKESSDKIFKTLNDAISDYKPKYDLYEKLLGLTGDRKKSSQLAFGKDAVDDYETFLRNQYAKMPGASFFSELTPPAEGATEEVKKAWKDLVEYIQS